MAVVLEQLKNETYPIVKWVGGKRQLMFELLKNLPKSYNRDVYKRQQKNNNLFHKTPFKFVI